MKKVFCVLAAAVMSTACMQMKNPIKPDRLISGRPVMQTVVEVPERYRVIDVYLPAGVYVPTAENDDGVYYLAPEKIPAKAWDQDGGVFIEFRDPSIPYMWATSIGATYIGRPIPNDFKFKLRER